MMARMFVSVPVADTSWSTSVSDALRACKGVSASPPEQLHITLRFIGDIDESRIPALVSAVEAACAGTGPFEVSIKGIGCFPNEKRPSVVWVGAEPHDRLTALSDGISRQLKKAHFRFDEKPFKSHITVGRCNGPTDISEVLAQYRGAEFCTFGCDHVAVVRSFLGPSGARHKVAAEIKL